MGKTSPNLMVIAPDDPSELGFPDTLPLEVALAERPVDAIFRAYGLDRLDYQRLCADPLFIRAVEEALDSLKKDGVTFKLKAKAQALVLLQTSFALIHDADTPASVKADMIKFTVRAAGLDASMDQKNANTLGGVNFQVVMNLGDN